MFYNSNIKPNDINPQQRHQQQQQQQIVVHHVTGNTAQPQQQQQQQQQFDNEQQIYANAPPKPRRYLYYDNTTTASTTTQNYHTMMNQLASRLNAPNPIRNQQPQRQICYPPVPTATTTTTTTTTRSNSQLPQPPPLPHLHHQQQQQVNNIRSSMNGNNINNLRLITSSHNNNNNNFNNNNNSNNNIYQLNTSQTTCQRLSQPSLSGSINTNNINSIQANQQQSFLSLNTQQPRTLPPPHAINNRPPSILMTASSAATLDDHHSYHNRIHPAGFSNPTQNRVPRYPLYNNPNLTTTQKSLDANKTKPSLDDQIKHLLIGAGDNNNRIVTTTANDPRSTNVCSIKSQITTNFNHHPNHINTQQHRGSDLQVYNLQINNRAALPLAAPFSTQAIAATQSSSTTLLSPQSSSSLSSTHNQASWANNYNISNTNNNNNININTNPIHNRAINNIFSIQVADTAPPRQNLQRAQSLHNLAQYSGGGLAGVGAANLIANTNYHAAPFKNQANYVQSCDNTTTGQYSNAATQRYCLTSSYGSQYHQQTNIFERQKLHPTVKSTTDIAQQFYSTSTMGNRYSNHRRGAYEISHNTVANALSSSQAPSSLTESAKQQQINSIGTDETNSEDNTIGSQLIVDLTTPKVLTRTQTYLTKSNVPNATTTTDTTTLDQWSMNQVGLPQTSVASTTTTEDHAKMRDMLQMQTTGLGDVTSYNEPGCDKMSGSDKSSTTNSLYQRTAPYYYSDLKSKEQQEALMNIVQQKSLSPPPQLLSRSTDLIGTRLAHKSATMQPSQARALSENFQMRMNQQRNHHQQQLSQQSSSSNMKNQHTTNNFHTQESSDTSLMITKNIDSLFDASTPKTLVHARSMMTLNPMESKDLTKTNLYVDPRHESMSTNNLSKSKSLENVFKLGGRSHPVYENIRCSDKLMVAVNDSLNLSSAVDRLKSSSFKAADLGPMHSDESMDSILGSSLEDSDSHSDIIDELEISSTENHVDDIAELIKQLKSNHSKLTEDYKSTLVRISKTINSTNNEQLSTNNNDQSSTRLARQLQLLALKSKKYESRSKNQLALIHMMEKVLRLSKVRTTHNDSNRSHQPYSSSGSDSGQPTSFECESSTTKNGTRCRHLGSSHAGSSPSSSCQDILNTPPIISVENQTESVDKNNSGTNSTGLKTSSNSRKESDKSKSHQPDQIIRAIVTESKNARKVEHVNQDTSLQQQSENLADVDLDGDKKSSHSKTNNGIADKIRDIELRTNTNNPHRGILMNKSKIVNSGPFEMVTESDTIADLSDASISISSIDDELSKPLLNMVSKADNIGEHASGSRFLGSDCSETLTATKSKSGCSSFMQDADDDFIEFLDNPSLSSRRGQEFRTSQFSASDFKVLDPESHSSRKASASQRVDENSPQTSDLSDRSKSSSSSRSPSSANQTNARTRHAATSRTTLMNNNNSNHSESDELSPKQNKQTRIPSDETATPSTVTGQQRSPSTGGGISKNLSSNGNSGRIVENNTPNGNAENNMSNEISSSSTQLKDIHHQSNHHRLQKQQQQQSMIKSILRDDPARRSNSSGISASDQSSGKLNGSMDKFNTVLGNVIDVDVCPLVSQVSHCSQ